MGKVASCHQHHCSCIAALSLLGGTKATEKQRRRLTLGKEISESPLNDHDKLDLALLAELSQTNLMEFLKSVDSAGHHTGIVGSKMDSSNMRRSFGSKTLEQQGSRVEEVMFGVGFACKKGLKPESPNQDSLCIIKVDNDFSIYGVFDGHGTKGHAISDFVKENLPKLMLRDERFKTKTADCLRDAFKKMQDMLAANEKTDEKVCSASMSGTTACVVVHHHVSDTIFVAHVGDSGCCVSRRISPNEIAASALTKNHKPQFPEEKRRIERNGGRVAFDGFANHRVYARNEHYPGLNMSRCLGDLLGHSDAGLTSEPDIKEFQLAPEDECIVLCTDGVTEFISWQELVDLLGAFGPENAQAAAEKLAKDAWDRWLSEEGGMVVDDITAVVIYTHPPRERKLEQCSA